MTSNIIRISLEQIQIGMISAENIFSPSGLKLISKGSSITQNHLFRLKLYQIFHLHVYMGDSSKPLTNKVELHQDLSSLEYDTDFKCFRKNYIQTIGKINILIYSLIEGNNILDELYDSCTSLLSYLPNKTDLFVYLYNIDSKTYKEATLIHGLNVGIICAIVGEWFDLTEVQIKELVLAGLLHDIGKFNISDSIINKAGRLTSEEFEIIKTHPISGYKDIETLDLAYGIKMAILQHHEKVDGSGYPYGFKSNQIHEYARIVSIIDIYDAMTSDRTYHRRITPFCVINFLEEEGCHLLDNNYLSTFLENLAELYTGKTAVLSNGEHGKIMYINRRLPSRPLVQAGTKTYNLEFETSLNIVDII